MEAAQKQLPVCIDVKDELFYRDVVQAKEAYSPLYDGVRDLMKYQHLPELHQEQAYAVFDKLLDVQIELNKLLSLACGEEHLPAKEVSGGEPAEVASSVETPRKPSAAAGSTFFITDDLVCVAEKPGKPLGICGYSADRDGWDYKTTFAGNRLEPKEEDILCPRCGGKNTAEELTPDWLKDFLKPIEHAVSLVETLNDE